MRTMNETFLHSCHFTFTDVGIVLGKMQRVIKQTVTNSKLSWVRGIQKNAQEYMKHFKLFYLTVPLLQHFHIILYYTSNTLWYRASNYSTLVMFRRNKKNSFEEITRSRVDYLVWPAVFPGPSYWQEPPKHFEIALSLQHVIKCLEWNIKTRGNARAWSLNTWPKCSQQCHSLPQQSLYDDTKSLVGSKLMIGPYSKWPAPYFKATELQMVLVQADFGHQPEFSQYALRRESWWLITRAYIDVYKSNCPIDFEFLKLVSPCLACKVPKPQPTPPRNTPRSFLQAYISWKDSAHK